MSRRFCAVTFIFWTSVAVFTFVGNATCWVIFGRTMWVVAMATNSSCCRLLCGRLVAMATCSLTSHVLHRLWISCICGFCLVVVLRPRVVVDSDWLIIPDAVCTYWLSCVWRDSGVGEPRSSVPSFSNSGLQHKYSKTFTTTSLDSSSPVVTKEFIKLFIFTILQGDHLFSVVRNVFRSYKWGSTVQHRVVSQSG